MVYLKKFAKKTFIKVKKFLISIFLVFAVSLLMAQAVRVLPTNRVEERSGKQYYIHIVEKGQTVYSIAKAYNVGVDEIYYENSGSKNGISVNQELLIPTVNKESEIRQEIKLTDFEFFYHVCAANENFSIVADIYLQPENNIRQANPDSRPPFKEGQYLKIPVVIPESVVRTEFPSRPERKPLSNTSKPKKKANTVSFNPNMPVLTDYRHVVIDGETTSGIASKYSVSLNDLKAVNPGLSDFVEKGERLRIPATASFNGKSSVSKQVKPEEPVMPATEKEANIKDNKSQERTYVVHTVKKKETIYRISREYGVSIQDLYDANPSLSDKIKVGQKIRVPKKKITKDYVIYDVGGKTRLKKIAKLYGVSEIILIRKNPTIGKYAYLGQEVKVPVGNKAIIVSKKEEELVETPEEILTEDPKKMEVVETGPCKKELPFNTSQINIALMVPLYLEEMQDSLKVDDVRRGNAQGFQPFTFVKFVEGAMMAVDSMRKAGVNVNLKVYDVDKSLTKTTKVLQDAELKNMDLIIGPFYNQSFNQVALFAGNFGIPIVNPLSYRESILKEYTSAIKVKPSENAQIPLVREIVRQYHPTAKVFLITQTSYRDADKTLNIENALKEVIIPSVKFSNSDLVDYSTLIAMADEEWLEGDKIPVYQMEGKRIDPLLLQDNIDDSTYFDNSLVRINYMPQGFEPFMKQASALRENVVVLYGRDKSFVMNVMNQLNEFRDSLNISLIGLPVWETFNNVDHTQMDNLNTVVFESSYIDFDDEQTQDFIYNFRQNYSSDPGKYGFAGYDISWFFINAMYYFGNNFLNCLPKFETSSYSSNMWFKKSYHNSFENLHWDIIQYHNFEKRKLNLRLEE
jgi:LysM repeat protein